MKHKKLSTFLSTSTIEEKMNRYATYQRLIKQSSSKAYIHNVQNACEKLKKNIMCSPEFLKGQIKINDGQLVMNNGEQKAIGTIMKERMHGLVNSQTDVTISVKTKTMKECKKEQRIEFINTEENQIQSRYGRLVKNASNRGIKVKLTLKQFTKLYKETHCAYTGVKFVKDDKLLGFSVDRIDSTKGYSKNNVVACTIQANSLKEHILERGDMFNSPDDLYTFAKNVLEYSKK